MAQAQLGSLEQQVMDALWRGDGTPATVRDVLEQVINDGRSRSLAYNTVMSVMSRLAEKGYLDRERSGRSYVYQAATADPDELAQQQAITRFDQLAETYGDEKLVIAAFVSWTQQKPERGQTLSRLT